MPPTYILGVDVGSTKTQAIVTDAAGRTLGLGRAGSGNYQSVGYDGMAAALRASAGAALAAAGLEMGQIAAAALGVSGYDWPEQLPQMAAAVRAAGILAPAEIVNDAVLGLAAGAPDLWGLALVSGTGSNCRGRDRHGREGRVSGEGVRFGEYGGASELAFLAFQAVSRAWSRRGPPTSLSHALAAACGARDLDDLIAGVSQGRYDPGAELAPLIFAEAQAGDAVARSLIRELAEGLASLAIGVIRQLDLAGEAFPVVLVGSLFQGGPLLTDPLGAAIGAVAPGARLTRLAAPPVVGAALLAIARAGGDVAAARARLI